MALPKSLWLPPTALGKVDDENYRALVIDKAHLPAPENQSGSKRLIVETMASVGITTDVTDIVYAPAPGDTRPGFVTVRFVAQVTEGAQLNAKKVWASHPLGRFEAVGLPDIGVFTINGVTNVEMARLPFGGAGYHVGALVRGVNMVENRLNEERLTFVQEEIVRPMAIAVCDKQRVFETDRKATHEAIAADATKSESDRKVANAIVASASAKLEALSLINGDINRYFETFIKPLNPFNVADAFDKTALIAPRDDTDRSNNKSRMRIANGFAKESGLPVVAVRVQGVSGTVKRCLTQILDDFARSPVVGNTEPLTGTWVREPVGFSASPSLLSEKRLTLNVIKTRLHAAACAIPREDVPAEWIHHPFAFDSLSASKSGLAPLAVDVLRHSLQDRDQMAEYARALATAADESNITIRVVINSDNLVVKQQQRAGGSEIYNFEDCVVTANERTGIEVDPNGIESGEAEVEFHDPTPNRLKSLVESQALRPQLQSWSNKVSPHLPWNQALEQAPESEAAASFAATSGAGSGGGGRHADGRLVSRQLQQINERLAKMDERITASEGNSMQIAKILTGIDERSRQTESALSTITPAFAQLCQEFAARGNSQAQIGWMPSPLVDPSARARGVAGALMPSAPAGTDETKADTDAAASTKDDGTMSEAAVVEPTEPPAKQPKVTGRVGAPPGAEADDNDSSEEEEITEQPMSKIARVGYRLRSGMAAVGAAAGSTTAPLLAALDAVNTFAQQARSASASGEGVAPVQAEDATVVDSDADALTRKIADREEELSCAYIAPQRF